MKDITSLRHNEEALAHNEVLFRSVIEQSNEGIVLIDNEGKVMIWNRRQVEITGLEPADTLGRYIWEVLYDLGTPNERPPQECWRKAKTHARHPSKNNLPTLVNRWSRKLSETTALSG